MNALRASQQQRVVHLYRHALKTQLNWAVDRNLWFNLMPETREEFERNRHITDVSSIEAAIKAGEERLEKNRHPDPYIVPYYVGGSKYARNPPVPPSITVAMDFGREGY